MFSRELSAAAAAVLWVSGTVQQSIWCCDVRHKTQNACVLSKGAASSYRGLRRNRIAGQAADPTCSRCVCDPRCSNRFARAPYTTSAKHIMKQLTVAAEALLSCLRLEWSRRLCGGWPWTNNCGMLCSASGAAKVSHEHHDNGDNRTKRNLLLLWPGVWHTATQGLGKTLGINLPIVSCLKFHLEFVYLVRQIDGFWWKSAR